MRKEHKVRNLESFFFIMPSESRNKLLIKNVPDLLRLKRVNIKPQKRKLNCSRIFSLALSNGQHESLFGSIPEKF